MAFTRKVMQPIRSARLRDAKICHSFACQERHTWYEIYVQHMRQLLMGGSGSTASPADRLVVLKRHSGALAVVYT